MFISAIKGINSLWPSDIIKRQPGGTKPLPEPMLINDQWGIVAFTS